MSNVKEYVGHFYDDRNEYVCVCRLYVVLLTVELMWNIGRENLLHAQVPLLVYVLRLLLMENLHRAQCFPCKWLANTLTHYSMLVAAKKKTEKKKIIINFFDGNKMKSGMLLLTYFLNGNSPTVVKPQKLN